MRRFVRRPVTLEAIQNLDDTAYPAGTAAGITDAAETARTQDRDLVGVYGTLESMVRGSTSTPQAVRS